MNLQKQQWKETSNKARFSFMKKLVTIQKIAIILLTVVIVVCCLTYNYEISPVDKNSEEIIEFEVTENQTLSTLGSSLKEANLIHSELFYKLYIKLHNITSLQAGMYELSPSMSLKEITDIFENGSTYNPNIITLTFKEGYNFRSFIKLITENTNISESDIKNTLKDEKYLDELIQKYYFLTDEIKNKKIYYSLEGYLYPNTYEIDKTWDVKKIFELMLNETSKKLEPYKNELEEHEYSFHEMLTLASIIELEGANSDDRNGIAGVFYNRLESGWSLGSDVTTYYAVGIDFNERDLYQSELDDYNAYNTRSSKMAGKLPVGPICNPSIQSIEAALNPTKSKYFYFVADKTGKTYFSKTYSEHNKTISKLKSEKLWYEYN